VKVLVTGSNGFLGAALVKRLLADGENVVRCFVRTGSDLSRLEAIQQNYKDDDRLEIFFGSLSSSASAGRALEGVGTVYHLAAGMQGDPADYFLNTVVASKNLLEASIRSASVKLVLVSSFSVYGVAPLPTGQVVNESTPLEPYPEKREVYGQAKLRQETLFWEYQNRYRLPLVVLRPGVIYGPGGGTALPHRIGFHYAGVFWHLGDDNILPLSYVDNCAEAIVLAGRLDQAIGQAYNVHDDDLPTCKEYLSFYKRYEPLRTISVPYVIALAVSKIYGKCNPYVYGSVPKTFTPYNVATYWKGTRFDNSKIKSLGWQQPVSAEEGMRRTFEGLKLKSFT